jgi:hypothetical protein
MQKKVDKILETEKNKKYFLNTGKIIRVNFFFLKPLHFPSPLARLNMIDIHIFSQSSVGCFRMIIDIPAAPRPS